MRIILLIIIGINLLWGESHVLTDSKTGLMWQDNENYKHKTLNEAIVYCTELNWAGLNDWRVPTIKELQSIVDIKRYNPAIKKGFKNYTSGLSFSSSRYVSNGSSYVWQIDFFTGATIYDNDRRDHMLNVRCVRDDNVKQDENVKQQKNKKNMSCTYFKVVEVNQLNIRTKPDGLSQIIAKVNRDENICVYSFDGKWGRTDQGWISRKYLKKDYVKSNFLLADIDYDGKNERLEWKYISGDEWVSFYQFTLYDNDGSVLWKGPQSNDYTPLVGRMGQGSYGNLPEIFDDIDGDGNFELVMGGEPEDPESIGFAIYRWNGKKFLKTQNDKNDLVWVDPPNGNKLQWTKIEQGDYLKKGKRWWAMNLEQSLNGELPILTVVGVKYPEGNIIMKQRKTSIRFTPTGAIIERWIK